MTSSSVFSYILLSVLITALSAQNESLTETLIRLDKLHSKCNGIDIREISIEKVHSLFESKSLTSTQLTKCYLTRIREMNPYLNAVLEVNPDALLIAAGLDLELKWTGERRGVLHGIPILVKDVFATNDKMETTSGSEALVGIRPVRDADVVASLRISGAVILGKANMAEFSFLRGSNIPNGWSSRGGQTKNAYNLKVGPSGSSSGSAVATAINLCVAAIGSETVLSIISPAQTASCVGLKPTSGTGMISTRGVITVSRFQDAVGPFTRSVMDTATLLDGMLAPGYHDPNLDTCSGSFSSCLRKENISKVIRIGIGRNPFWIPELLNSSRLPEQIPVLNKLLDKMREYHWITMQDPVFDTPYISIDNLRNITEQERVVLMHEMKVSINKYLKENTMQFSSKHQKIRNLSDIIKYYESHPDDGDYNTEFLELAEATDGLENTTYLEGIKWYRGVANEYFNDLLNVQNFDAIAVPSEAHKHTQIYSSSQAPALLNGCGIAAVAGLPTITVPAGYDSNGIPFGICFVGKANQELMLLRIAKIVETIWPARKPPRFINTFS